LRLPRCHASRLAFESLVPIATANAKNKEKTMAQNITERAKDIINEALANVPAISVEDALSLVDSDDHVFVDLRDRSEQTKTGGITGAVASSRGMLERGGRGNLDQLLSSGN
jgi:hypothetical protein